MNPHSSMQAGYLPYKSSQIHYLRMGTGPNTLFCLHGFGESAQHFYLFEAILGQKFTLIAVDLPFHGATQWTGDLVFTPQDLMAVFQQLDPHPGQAWHFMGYSMGGRLLLHMTQLFPEKVAGMYLLAPDGLRLNPWYWLATQTKAGNKLFRYTMYQPQWALGLVKWAVRWNLLNRSIQKFIDYYLGDATIREELYIRWTTLRSFRPHLNRLAKKLQQHQIPVRLVFGGYDRIILPKRGWAFQQKAPEQVQVYVLEEGHQLLKERHLSAFAEIILG